MGVLNALTKSMRIMSCMGMFLAFSLQ